MKVGLLVNLLKSLPITPTAELLSRVGYLFHEKSSHKKEIHDAIASAFNLPLDHPEVDKLVRENFKHLITTILEILRFGGLKDRWSQLVDVSGIEYFQKEQNKGKGVILLGAHVGNWELLITGLPLLGVTDPYAFVWKHPESELNDLLNTQRRLWGTKLIWTQEYSEDQVARILSSGGTIYILADRYEQGKTRVNLFGQKIGIAAGPVLFARKYNCSIVPVYTYREGTHHKIIFEAPLQLKPLDTGEDLTEDLQLCMSIIEKWILCHPEQWIWLFKRGEWKKTEKKGL